MDNNIAKTCKVTSIILAVLGVIGSLVIGFNIGGALKLVTILMGLATTFVSSLTLYAIGEAVEHAYEANQRIYNLSEKYENSLKANVQTAKPVVGSNVKPATNGWTCKKCGASNSINATSCKACGEYK